MKSKKINDGGQDMACSKNKEIFDKNPSNVNISRRIFAYIIDWLLGALIMMLPMWIIWLNGNGDPELLNAVSIWTIAVEMSYQDAYIAGFLALMFALFYYVFIPWKVYKGQTIGKRMMGFKIVRTDDSEVELKELILRQVVGIIVIESVLYNVSLLWEGLISLMIGYNISIICMFIGFLITAGSCLIALSNQSRRMLHDYIAKTKVILLKK